MQSVVVVVVVMECVMLMIKVYFIKVNIVFIELAKGICLVDGMDVFEFFILFGCKDVWCGMCLVWVEVLDGELLLFDDYE